MTNLKEEMNGALKDVPIVDLLRLTEMLYSSARTDIANGTTTDQETIRACNAARKEIDLCKKQGIGR